MKDHRLPVIVLLALAPVCGELLSGSAPPVEFFSLFGVTVLVALYGCGALLVREIALRWGKGLPSIFLLGLAYGIFEEGIVVRSFFDPSWPDLGILATYGRAMGVNWIWAIVLSLYHALVSISLPIALAGLIFPRHRRETWLGRRGLWISAGLFVATAFVGPLVGMQATPPMLLGCVVVMACLAWLARRLPDTLPRADLRLPSPLGASAAGFLGMLALLIVMWVMPGLSLPPAVTALAGLLYTPMLGWAALRLNAPAWDDLRRWAWAAGGLTPWVLLAFLAEADNANRPDDTTGMALVGLVFLLFLAWLGWRVRGRVEGEIAPLERLRS
jgi:hypothetical protein